MYCPLQIEAQRYPSGPQSSQAVCVWTGLWMEVADRWLGGQIGLTRPQFKHSHVTLKGNINVNSIQNTTFAGGDLIAFYLTYRTE